MFVSVCVLIVEKENRLPSKAITSEITVNDQLGGKRSKFIHINACVMEIANVCI